MAMTRVAQRSFSRSVRAHAVTAAKVRHARLGAQRLKKPTFGRAHTVHEREFVRIACAFGPVARRLSLRARDGRRQHTSARPQLALAAAGRGGAAFQQRETACADSLGRHATLPLLGDWSSCALTAVRRRAITARRRSALLKPGGWAHCRAPHVLTSAALEQRAAATRSGPLFALARAVARASRCGKEPSHHLSAGAARRRGAPAVPAVQLEFGAAAKQQRRSNAAA
jgi:hypothetical protein